VSRSICWLVAIATGVTAQRVCDAQELPPLQGEVRGDVFVARGVTVHAGAGVNVLAGQNVRISIVAGAGRAFEDAESEFSARVEVTGRFLMDPAFSAKWGMYAGGGVGLRKERSNSFLGVLILVLGAEGQRWGAFVPFVETGYGGGLRLSAGLRQGLIGRR
jgi:hypothetical protein